MRLLRLAAIACAFSAALLSDATAAPLSIATGPKTGTYIAIGRDIAQAVKQENLTVDVKATDGSIDNIKRINTTSSPAIGIVQSDVLGFLGRSKNADSQKMAQHLRMIFPLYHEEVHLLARNTITRFEDLKNKKVVVGEDGSGHMLTAVNLFAMMDVTPGALIKKPTLEGVADVLEGKADAVIFVGGKPVKLFKNLEGLKTEDNQKYQHLLSDVHFVPLDAPKMLEEYAPATLAPADYDFVQAPIPTIAVTAVLVTYDYSAAGKRDNARCRELYALNQAIRKHMDSLKANGHPKWKEVNMDSPLAIWKKDTCAWKETPAEAQQQKKSEKKKTKKRSHKSSAKKRR